MAGRLANISSWALAATLSIAPSPSVGARKRNAVVGSPMQVVRVAGKTVVNLAGAVQRAVRRYFPKFRVAGYRDFDPAFVRDLEESYHSTGKPAPFVPFACAGDFDGHGLPDIALLLKNRHRSQQWYLVAFHQTVRGTFRPHRIGPGQGFPGGLADNPSGWLEFYLLKQPAGALRYCRFDNTLETAVLHLKHDGIVGVWAEEASRLYYFRKGRYRYVQLGN